MQWARELLEECARETEGLVDFEARPWRDFERVLELHRREAVNSQQPAMDEPEPSSEERAAAFRSSMEAGPRHVMQDIAKSDGALRSYLAGFEDGGKAAAEATEDATPTRCQGRVTAVAATSADSFAKLYAGYGVNSHLALDLTLAQALALRDQLDELLTPDAIHRAGVAERQASAGHDRNVESTKRQEADPSDPEERLTALETEHRTMAQMWAALKARVSDLEMEQTATRLAVHDARLNKNRASGV